MHGVDVKIFEPATLGPLRLRNRVIKAATFEGRTPNALVTDELIEFHRTVAAGGVGMTTVAYCASSPEGRTDRHQMWMRPEAVPGLTRLTEAVHAEGAAISAQIGHAGPVANSKSNRATAVSASWQISPLSLRLTKTASALDLDRIVTDHARAARIAVDSGFDSVELHFGHNYLVSSFLSPALNHRSDRFGGSLKNRARVALAVAAAVRAEVGTEIAITAKLNMDDGVPGGFWLAESMQVAQWLERDGSLDALELTAGSSLKNPMYLFRGDVPLRDFAASFPQPQRMGIRMVGTKFLRAYPYHEAYLLDQARQFLSAVNLPIILLGGISTRTTMDRALAEGFQFVAMARALLREPDLINRMHTEETTNSLCIHCNRCMPTIYSGTRCVLVPEKA